MPRYIVERSLPGISPEDLTAAARRAKHATTLMRDEGRPVRYLRSTFVPDEAKCFCLFEAEAPEDVAEAQHRANLPFDSIAEALHISSDDLD